MTVHATQFRAGDPVYLRSTFADHVGAVMPCVLVEETAAHVALFQPAGTSMLLRTGRRGGPTARTMYPGGWDGGHVEVPWEGSGVLRVHGRGQPWSVWRWLDGDRWRPGCYVNLERPWVRSPIGFDTTDWILDLVVGPDDAISWKDDDELRWSVEVGATSLAAEAAIRAAGRQAADAFGARRWPWNADWNRWLPAPGRTAPALHGSNRELALRMF